MNKVELTGKVLKAYINDDGFFVCTLAVVHDHYVNGVSMPSESIVRCFLADEKESQKVDIIEGDRVYINGYLRQDRTLSLGGKERKHVNIYINEISLLKPRN